MASMPVSKTAHAGSNPASPANYWELENYMFSGFFVVFRSENKFPISTKKHSKTLIPTIKCGYKCGYKKEVIYG